MKYINGLLLEIKTKYAVCIGKKDIYKLSTYITGYTHAVFDLTGYKSPFWGEFQEFVQKKVGIEQTGKHWSELLSMGRTQEEAFDLFYEYYEEFRDIKNN